MQCDPGEGFISIDRPYPLTPTLSPWERERTEWVERSHLDHPLDMHATAIHLIFQIDHRWPIEMPGQARAQRAALAEFAFQERKHVANGVELHARGLAPVTTKRAHPPLHLVQHPLCFLQHRGRADITEPN